MTSLRSPIPLWRPNSKKRSLRAKLIFNPGSGAVGQSPLQLMDVIHEMQAWNMVPEAFLVEPGCDLAGMTTTALADGIRMFVVCGGDGTVDFMASLLAGTHSTLGIIPTGTQNNVALSLGIPNDIPGAIAILRTGKRTKVDMGKVVCGEFTQLFLEVCTVGLVSALFTVADEIQHGHLARIGDFLSAFVAAPPSVMHLTFDGHQEVDATCHVLLISNMPYVGPHYQVGTLKSIDDGLLDVLLFADLTKIDLLNYAVQAARTGGEPEDLRIQHFHTRKLIIETDPPMSVIADGLPLGQGPLQISVRRKTLAVMVGIAETEELPSGFVSEEDLALLEAGSGPTI